MKTISVEGLKDLLAGVKGATPVTFIAVTDARARTTNNPYTKLGSCYKVAKVNAMVGTDHEAAVERQQAREGRTPSYTAQSRAWGERISSALVHKDGAYYLPVQLNPVVRPRPVYLVPQMRGSKVRLTPVLTEVIAPFLPPERRKERAAHQGVERLVERKDYRLSNLVSLSLNGQTYRVRT